MSGQDISEPYVPVDLRGATRLIGHGPTTLVTSAHGDRRNVMAAQWVMALDFDPPRATVVIDGATYTRELVEASGELGLSVPTAAMADLTLTVGSSSGRGTDKFAHHNIATRRGRVIGAPLVDGCAAFLECRLLRAEYLAGAMAHHDLFVVEIVAAWADARSWRDGRWQFPSDSARTIHHSSRGLFYLTGPTVQATTR